MEDRKSRETKLYDVKNGDGKEKFILFAVSCGDEKRAENSLKELKDLLETADGESLGYMIQNLEIPDRTTYLGKGKVAELKEMVEALEADGVICDDELTPSQHRNLADLLNCKVVDRTMLILDIFAKRATTGEGKIQVEMAQLKYRATRLTGKGTALSRLGGGIGTRGPGETKLEVDRRTIQRRIDKLTQDLKALRAVRNNTRRKRVESSTPIVAIVGYTNAGKSTLINRLTDAEVVAVDKLFATLDPTTKVCRLPGGQEVLFTDTVGFINKLPHQLIDAFRSTLEEAKYADIILHMVDSSSPNAELHMQVVHSTLKNLGVSNKPIITAFNKVDLVCGAVHRSYDEEGEQRAYDEDGEGILSGTSFLRDEMADIHLELSALNGDGVEDLLSSIQTILRDSRVYIDTIVSYVDSEMLKRIRKYGQVMSEEYAQDGIQIKAYVPKELAMRISSKVERKQ